VRIDRLDLPDIGDGLGDDPKPGSRQALQRRLDDLSHGHPSSPYNEDGSHKPPVPDVRDYELPEAKEPAARPDRPLPLTDAEHAEHVRDIRICLDKARADGLATDHQHTIDPAREVWSEERDAVHDSIIESLYAGSAAVPCEHKAILAGGLGGAGKSTVLDGHAGVDRSQYLTINPDVIKEEMASRGAVPHVPGLSPMEASDLVHEESSYVARQLALRAQSDGKNVIWDITMSSGASTERRIQELRSASYTSIEGIFVDIPVETSVARADARHRQGHDEYRAGESLGGRFVPAEVIRGQADSEWGSLNRMTFETIKHRFDKWSLFDNSVDGGSPVLVYACQREETAP
jgi:predicted kinase